MNISFYNSYIWIIVAFFAATVKQYLSRICAMFKKFLLLLVLSPVFIGSPVLCEETTDVVKLSMPESVLREAVAQSLPYEIDTSSQSIEGNVFVKKIENLELNDQSLSALLVLAGKDVRIATKIGGHQLRLNVGDVEIECNMSALVRYDEKSSTLFVKPAVSEYSASGNGQGNELGTLLVALLNGREFPVKVEKLQPLVTDLGDRQLAVDLMIQDIIVSENMMSFHFKPSIKTLSAQKK